MFSCTPLSIQRIDNDSDDNWWWQSFNVSSCWNHHNHPRYPRPLIVVLCHYLQPKPWCLLPVEFATVNSPSTWLVYSFLPNVRYRTDRNRETLLFPCDPLSAMMMTMTMMSCMRHGCITLVFTSLKHVAYVLIAFVVWVVYSCLCSIMEQTGNVTHILKLH